MEGGGTTGPVKRASRTNGKRGIKVTKKKIPQKKKVRSTVTDR